MVKLNWFLPVVLVLLTSCNLNPSTSVNSNGADSSETDATQEQLVTNPSTEKLTPPSSSAQMISTEGIGEVKLGMTLGEVKQKLGNRFQFSDKKPFMVDLDAVAVSQDGEVHFHILFWSYEGISDTKPIQFLLTENPMYRTTEGVGAGTPIAQAESVYGEATLNYNSENESREYVQFAQAPVSNLSFRSEGSPDNFDGIYVKFAESSYQETNNFKEKAAIGAIMIQNIGG